jgi:hypothetical protein
MTLTEEDLSEYGDQVLVTGLPLSSKLSNSQQFRAFHYLANTLRNQRLAYPSTLEVFIILKKYNPF